VTNRGIQPDTLKTKRKLNQMNNWQYFIAVGLLIMFAASVTFAGWMFGAIIGTILILICAIALCLFLLWTAVSWFWEMICDLWRKTFSRKTK